MLNKIKATSFFKQLYPVSYVSYASFGRRPNQQAVALNFKAYNLLPEVEEALKSNSIFIPTGIQDRVIPYILQKPSDVFFAAQTGTGKTLAYALPICNQLKQKELGVQTQLTQPNRPRAIIIQPNKELTLQTQRVFKNLSHFVKLRSISLCNGYSTLMKEKQKLAEGADILVSTLDRLDKHVLRHNLHFSQMNYMVFDEFDTLLDADYGDKITSYIKMVSDSESIEKIIFLGATFTGRVRDFMGEYKAQFRREIDVLIDDNTHLNLSNLEHEFMHSKGQDRLQLIKEIFEKNKKHAEKTKGGSIIFCNTVACCRALEYFMQKEGYPVVSLHGEMPNKMRIQNYERFRRQEVPTLISSDLASRGLDFKFVNHVINFEFPKTTSDYLHRAGRAGRAGLKGKVTSIFQNKNNYVVNELKRSIANEEQLDIRGSSYALVNKEQFKELKTNESLRRATKSASPSRLPSSADSKQLKDNKPNKAHTKKLIQPNIVRTKRSKKSGSKVKALLPAKLSGMHAVQRVRPEVSKKSSRRAAKKYRLVSRIKARIASKGK